jgi:asparagine synthase (glutamine-hydrolysing)
VGCLMCGLTGLVRHGLSAEELEQLARRMTAPITHRGPDDEGYFVDPANGVAFGFRRLAIIDLSAAGHQPMRSRSGRFTIIFNGEVFNHRAIRAELASREGGAAFRGHSDTEVMLEAFEAWGIEGAVRRFIGMFAMAVWDASERTLNLVRDRLGIKPLFYWQRDSELAFASELKSLVALPDFPRRLDRGALISYLRYLYVPAPRSIYQDVRKLLPGHILTFPLSSGEAPRVAAYWSAVEAARRGAADRLDVSDAELVEQLDTLLRDSVKLRLESDVPLGALLSGGVDSSTVVALMQEASSSPVQTFTIGFDRPEHDEARYARDVARHLGTDHTELYLGGADALEVLPRLPTMLDEPLADPSSIPTYLVSALARRNVTVALTGDGGDEVFGGYNRYRHGAAALHRLARVPSTVRRVAAGALATVGPAVWDRVFTAAGPVFPRRSRPRLAGERVQKLVRLLRTNGTAARYRGLMSAWDAPADLVPGTEEPADGLGPALENSGPLSLVERMMLADQGNYLADDLLAKVDRTSMAVSLEARVPLLDHRVVELGWRLPVRAKLRDGEGKWILRQVLARRVPAQLVDRPKVGFTVPIGDWLRGPLAQWSEELLAPERLREGGVLSPDPIRDEWTSFRAGRRSNPIGLWAVLMFQAWRETWRPVL